MLPSVRSRGEVSSVPELEITGQVPRVDMGANSAPRAGLGWGRADHLGRTSIAASTERVRALPRTPRSIRDPARAFDDQARPCSPNRQIKRKEESMTKPDSTTKSSGWADGSMSEMDRRRFLRNAGIAVGTVAIPGSLLTASPSFAASTASAASAGTIKNRLRHSADGSAGPVWAS